MSVIAEDHLLGNFATDAGEYGEYDDEWDILTDFVDTIRYLQAMIDRY